MKATVRLALLFLLTVLSLACGNSGPSQPATPSSYDVAFTQSFNVTNATLEVVEYDTNNTQVSDNFISGSNGTLAFSTGHTVDFILRQGNVTCPGVGQWGVTLTVASVGTTLTSTGTSIVPCYEGLGYMVMEAQIEVKVGTSITKVF